MSKHETALALVDEQIEKTEKEKSQCGAKVALARQALDRAEKEMKLVDWTLSELHGSRNALLLDRQMQHGVEEPAEL